MDNNGNSSSPQFVANRRAHQRLDCGGSAEIHLFPDDEKLVGTVVDLSVGGCCLELEANVSIKPGQRLEVLLQVKDAVLIVAGVLRNVRKRSFVGIQFRDVSRRKELQIKELMAELFGETFYRWKAKCAGLEVDQVRQTSQLQEENLRLKRLVADLTLDKTLVQDVLSKKR